MSTEIKKLLELIEEKLDWGESNGWQGKDFEKLNHLILDETGVSLSASTLKRVWGKVEYNHLPSMTTLDAIAKFGGFENWRNYLKSRTQVKKQEASSSTVFPQQNTVSKKWIKTVSIVGIIVAIGLVCLFAFKETKKPGHPSGYSFSSEPVTRDIPSSVIFNYDASGSLADSIFIQQSWDERTRALVNKNEHTHTSVYYEPGFYQAKLIAGKEIVKEHLLLIPTKGWLGLIDHKPVPVYLQPQEFKQADRLSVTEEVIQKKNITMQPQPPMVKYYNVGNFDSVSINDFSFSTDIKNDYSSGSAICQLSYIFLITDAAPVTIPLSAKGCVSELFLRAVDYMVSGKKTDLSGFGVDFNNWIHVACNSEGGKIRYFVNDKEVYSCSLPDKPVHIVGLGFYFQGTGSVKNIRLFSKEELLFHDFTEVTK
ncbi:MAG: hypothetical protein ABI675_00540 [Chitinophagaceae bacterium]